MIITIWKTMIAGIPSMKLRCSVLCRMSSMVRYTPGPPPMSAQKNS